MSFNFFITPPEYYGNKGLFSPGVTFGLDHLVEQNKMWGVSFSLGLTVRSVTKVTDGYRVEADIM